MTSKWIFKNIGFSIHCAWPAQALATRPPANARPCHAHPTRHPSFSPATQRPTFPNSASGEREKPLGGRLALSPGRRRIVRKCKSPPHQALYCYCCTADWGLCPVCCRWGLVGTYCCTAVSVLVVGRSVGGRWAVSSRWWWF